MEVIKNECISKIEVVRILQKAYAEGRIQAKDGLVSILDNINAADVQPVDKGYLIDWYISSVSEEDSPVWTEEHIEELCHDFYVIPKEG